MKNLLKKYGHIWVMGYALIYLPWFFHLEKTVVRDYRVMHVALDDKIPFNEYFIIPYLLWFVYVAGTVCYFFFTDKQQYYQICTFLFVGMTICLLICTFFPNGTDLRRPVDPQKNFCSYLVYLIRFADTSTNVFPSIHVYNSIGVHCALHNSPLLKQRKWLQIMSFILMISICLSTMFLKQHSAVDVLGAVILAYVLYPFVYGAERERSPKPARKLAR